MSDEYEWVVGAVITNGFLITLGCVSDVINYIIGLHCHDLPSSILINCPKMRHSQWKSNE